MTRTIVHSLYPTGTSWNTHREQRCEPCDGTGYTHEGRRRCVACGCAGVVFVNRQTGEQS